MKGQENLHSGIKKGLELKQTKQTQLISLSFNLLRATWKKKNDKTSCFNDLFIKKVYERGAFFQ